MESRRYGDHGGRDEADNKKGERCASLYAADKIGKPAQPNAVTFYQCSRRGLRQSIRKGTDPGGGIGQVHFEKRWQRQ
jgi:hypothetical protein